MDRRTFLAAPAVLAAATLSQKADAAEQAMSQQLDRLIGLPWMCDVNTVAQRIRGEAPDLLPPKNAPRALMGDDPRLPKMPSEPTLVDFFRLRFAPAGHLLQSANLARNHGYPEKIVFACLLHDIAVSAVLRGDHGYWGAQLIEPYVDPEITWAIRAHQSLRFFPDPAVGYEYPDLYLKLFGPDYKPEPYVVQAYQDARKHKWYMSARLITMNDLYAFDPKTTLTIDAFIDVIGRHFRQPKSGLGFDSSPVAHMWRSIIWPNNIL